MTANRLAVSLTSIVLCAGSVTAAGHPKRPGADHPSTQPADAPNAEAAATTPASIVGKWIYGSVGPTTYWDADTGAFVGNARGSAGIYEFDDAGHYKEYVYLEMRTGTFTTKAWTVHEGTVTFSGDRFTITPQRGHYLFWTNGNKTTDRDMTPEEAAKLAKTYAWTLTKDDAGKAVFTVPFEDGSKFVYHRQEAE